MRGPRIRAGSPAPTAVDVAASGLPVGAVSSAAPGAASRSVSIDPAGAERDLAVHGLALCCVRLGGRSRSGRDPQPGTGSRLRVDLGVGRGVDLRGGLGTALVPAESATLIRTITWLRRLGATLRADPFDARDARTLGPELLATGLLGARRPSADRRRAAGGPSIVLPALLGLLRAEAVAALHLTSPDATTRLAVALDEMVGALLEPTDPEEGAGAPHETAAVTVPQLPVGQAVDRAGVGMAMVDPDGAVVRINPALRTVLGLLGPPAEPMPVTDLVHPADVRKLVTRSARLREGRADSARLQLRLLRPDGEVRWVQILFIALQEPATTATTVTMVDAAGPETPVPRSLLWVVEDVTERQLIRVRLSAADHRDQLARLPGSTVVAQWLVRAFAPDGPSRVGLCAIGLDGLHPVNDGVDPPVGDRLLLGVAGRLQLVAGEHVLARTGAYEFTVLVADPHDAADVGRLADRLLSALATPFHLSGQVVTVGASVGVAETSTASASAAELTRAAEAALSWAEALGGRRRVLFDPERSAAEAARLALVAGLRTAVVRGEFRLDYQSLVDLPSGRVRGAEALVRWQHPEHGLLGPGRFIELAEQSGAIVPLGRWVLQEACRRAAEWWRELGADAPFVSVNVSPVQMAEAGWVRDVLDVLARSGLPPELLQLEITEQAMLGDEDAVLAALAALRSAGVRLALDDFGTGYSSLGWLRRLPVHALKIDGSFIDGLRGEVADPTDTAIVRALVDMAHALGLSVTAEWVETPQQAHRLAALGCDLGQGRWFSDPGPGSWVTASARRSIDL